jgi:hypothetical protein
MEQTWLVARLLNHRDAQSALIERLPGWQSAESAWAPPAEFKELVAARFAERRASAAAAPPSATEEAGPETGLATE